MKTILGNEAAFNIVTCTLTNGFSGAATIVAGEITKSVLSGAAFFSNAERSLVNETVYKSELVTAVTKKIRETRGTKFDKIRKNLTQKRKADPQYVAVKARYEAVSEALKALEAKDTTGE